ncbi:MAG TPA: hypothetical protein VFD41_15555 [Actinomycetales bacterium]|nr:hypothetical protein [Actinomycetales bacterium]
MKADDTTLRLLLDQNFPNVPQGMRFDVLDKTVVVAHFAVVAPEYADVSTPDWMVYLLARERSFDVLVTSDKSQLNQDEELTALDATQLGLVTWKSPPADPVVLWGQLLAYMPQIVRKMRSERRTIVVLPSPRLSHEQFRKPGNIIRSLKVRDGESYQERKGRSMRFMKDMLHERGDDRLVKYLNPGQDDSAAARSPGS